MIADLKPYPKYKESGSRWLAEVPDHWDVRNLRTLIRPRTERNRADLPLLSVAREKGVFVRSLTDPSENHNVIPEDLSNYKVARGGDLVINKMKAWQGSMGIAPCDGIVSPAYYVFDFGIENAGFGQKLLRSKPYVAHFGQASDGVRVGQWDLSIPGMRLIPVLVPSPSEQASIVRFLDHWNGRLEKAIRSKRRVIALLQEQKQAIIHRAVTRGLDPNVKLKDSGIPWLGEIPEHWEVYRLSFLADFSNGKAHEQFFDSEGEFVCVNARFVSTGGTGIKYCTQNFWPARRGDVLMVMSDLPNGRALARAYLVNDDRKYAVNQRVCRLRSKRVEAGFLTYAANRNYGLLRHDDGSNQTHLSTGDYKTLPIQCPPAAEQQAIVRYLDAHVSKADVLVASLEREITLLREYRTRLTADVVTGKLDVRAAAAQLPEEVEDEPLPDPEIPEEETELEEVEG
jgi:type I restriction enzyme S subunit